ncbi:hypothetical protein LTR95_006834 [Oleoguttula sp. CCFEE 5521]
MTAVNQVFDTLELLEEILFQATIQDVLRAQRVSRTFQSLINASPRLQQKLFFAPVDLSSSNEHHTGTGINKLLCSALHVYYYPASGVPHNDLLPMDVPNRHELWHSFFYYVSRPRERRQSLPPGSWSRMLLLQPPVHERIDLRGGITERPKGKVLARVEGELVKYGNAMEKLRRLRPKEKPAKLRALHKLIVHMRKVSRACRGVKESQT